MNKLKDCRKLAGYTLAKLAIKTNLSPGYLCHLENGGRVNPSYKTMVKISNVLGKPINELFF